MIDYRAALLVGLWSVACVLAADGLDILLNDGFWERPIAEQGPVPAEWAGVTAVADNPLRLGIQVAGEGLGVVAIEVAALPG